MEAANLSLSDYLDILKRRKWSLILTSVSILAAAAALALLLPPIYKSTATILIEEQEIPPEFVRATVTSYAEERLQSINQRIMSTTRLLEIINQYGLYQDMRGRYTTDEIVAEMREAVTLEPISADVIDRRTGRPTTATIAFTLSYEGEDSPSTVQKVTNRLVSLYLSENLKVRERQAQETSEFFADEMNRVKTHLEEMDGRISDFKVAHIHELPEFMQVNLQGINDIEREMARLDDKLASLYQQENYLNTQLVSVPKELESPERKRLKELKVQMNYLLTRFSEQYPDVAKTRAEIARLEAQLKEARQGAAAEAPAENPDANPAYVTLSSQLASIQADIDSLQQQEAELKERLEKYRRRVAQSPQVEKQYRALVIERDNTRAKYEELMQKHMEATVSQALEKDQKGERFTLIDPPRLPEKPDRPNRLAILLIGVVLCIGGSLGMAGMLEFSDHSVRRSEFLAAAARFPVLAEIPFLQTEAEQRKRRRRLLFSWIGILAGSAALVAAFHFWVMDLDIFWIKVMRRLAL